MIRFGRTLWIALLLAIGGLCAPSAHAQTGTMGNVGHAIAVCVSRVQPGDTVRGMFAHPERFDCATPQSAMGPGDFWVLSTPLPRPSDANAAIRVRQVSLWQRQMALYARSGDGRIVGQFADEFGIGQRLRLGAVIEHRFVPAGAPFTRLLWRIDGASNLRGIVLGPRVATDAQSVRSDVLLAALYSAFAGLALGLLVYNFALWRVLRHDFQIAYCGLLGCLLLYALSSSGALAWLLPEMSNNRRILFSYITLCGGMATALTFCACFFEPRILDGWPLRAMRFTTFTFCTLAVVLMAIGPQFIAVLDRAFSVTMLLSPIVVLTALVRAWRRHSAYLSLFALSWAAPLTMLVARSFYNLGLLPWSFWVDNSTILAMTLETLLASVAIAYRMRMLSHERDEAIRQEAISRELADTDPLTGLLNRRAFLARAMPSDGLRTLMLFDIDHFKQVNDTIGHDGGDEVLRMFARTLRYHAPPGVLVARMGGEEFALLGEDAMLPDVDLMLASIRAVRLPFDLRITCSIGICRGPLTDENDWKRLYRMADQALFQAKAAGRDRAGRAPSIAMAA
ncbi:MULTISPECIES: GGDEF domain-containing protein [unclassified Sphingomonas]|uniref:GGDEF domain-containing protein n=1 Tax=unclassified Sphingomonas TaxID=196159 RepID=UPI00138F0E2C|nr:MULTISPECIES: diguanylate cyclase [unclassified Sphingomonas]